MIGKAHGLKVHETNVFSVEKWLKTNSACEIMDIKYSYADSGSRVLILYRG
jgi:hypothetical protein